MGFDTIEINLVLTKENLVFHNTAKLILFSPLWWKTNVCNICQRFVSGISLAFIAGARKH